MGLFSNVNTKNLFKAIPKEEKNARRKELRKRNLHIGYASQLGKKEGNK